MKYITGHQKPDIDSIVSAYALAELLKQKGEEIIPVIASPQVGPAATWLFQKFGLSLPIYLEDAAGHELYLVDHNSPLQSPAGIANAKVLGVLDHHPREEGTNYPDVIIDQVGSTATLIAEKFLGENLEIEPALAGILLGAILDDTVIFRSPTTTDRDRDVAQKLAGLAKIQDIEKFGIDLFTAKSDWSQMSTAAMIEADAKKWDFNGYLIYCATMETIAGENLVSQAQDILEAVRRKKESGGYQLALAMIVDILQEKSWVIIDPVDKEILEAILDGIVDENGIMTVSGILSRKKQIMKPLQDYFS